MEWYQRYGHVATSSLYFFAEHLSLYCIYELWTEEYVREMHMCEYLRQRAITYQTNGISNPLICERMWMDDCQVKQHGYTYMVCHCYRST